MTHHFITCQIGHLLIHCLSDVETQNTFEVLVVADMEQKGGIIMYKLFYCLQTGKCFMSLPADTNIAF